MRKTNSLAVGAVAPIPPLTAPRRSGMASHDAPARCAVDLDLQRCETFAEHLAGGAITRGPPQKRLVGKEDVHD
jgi:hypothetical protein